MSVHVRVKHKDILESVHGARPQRKALKSGKARNGSCLESHLAVDPEGASVPKEAARRQGSLCGIVPDTDDHKAGIPSFSSFSGRILMNECIGIIAGSGQFPRLVARGAREAGFSVAICGLHGNAGEDLSAEADAFTLVHLGQLNRMLDFFRAHGVRRLCMAGAVSKPRALDLRPDTRAMRLLFSLRKNKGDDALLRALIEDYEREGIVVLGAADLVPSLRCPAGVLGRVGMSEAVREAIAYGFPRLAVMGRLDIGQCLVVREAMVMAVECLEGTDKTLRRGAELGGEGCVALKMAKPGQEERVDLPSVGLQTIQLLVDNKYAALVLEAGKTLFFDREQATDLADRNNLCLVALTRDEILAFSRSTPEELSGKV